MRPNVGLRIVGAIVGVGTAFIATGAIFYQISINDPSITSGGGLPLFFSQIGAKIDSIITSAPLIGNLTPARDLRGTWVSSLRGKGIQLYGKFVASQSTTLVYEEGDIELNITAMNGNTATGTIRMTNTCSWGQTTAPGIPVINVPRQCITDSGAGPISIRVSSSHLDFGTVSYGDVTATMQGNYTTNLMSGTMTANIAPYGVLKGEFHLNKK